MELGEAQPVQLLLKETQTGFIIGPELTLHPTRDDPYVVALKKIPAQLRRKKLLELLNLKARVGGCFRSKPHRAWFH